MNRPIGIAVVGCGYWGVNYCRVFNELAESRVVTVCDPRGDRLREVTRHFPGVQGMTDVEAAVTAAGVDAVVVATTASTHYDVAERCLKAGKHALVEKPLTTRSEEAGALGTLAEARSLVLMVGHTFIYPIRSSGKPGRKRGPRSCPSRRLPTKRRARMRMRSSCRPVIRNFMPANLPETGASWTGCARQRGTVRWSMANAAAI